ncbi:hypothetical protein [Legionella quinlivanii]|uniref:hypothetical protein n=1 Tax=Legionella quinlivanii TaxID=45073 RepID=UPI002243CB4B|nr:hypothetical protein [Legionella quinlivanii]MCW8451230.1 hypothetical protein [Legionella quinlivanii]
MNWTNVLICGTIGSAFSAVKYFTSKQKSKTISALAFIALSITIYLFSPYISNIAKASKLEEKYKENQLLNTISKKHPDEFKEFINNSKKAVYNHEPQTTIDAYTISLIRRVFSKHLNTASDEAIFKLITTQRDIYQILLKEHPGDIVKFELNQLDDSVVNLEESYPHLMEQIQKIQEEVILSENTVKTPIDTTLAKKKMASIYSSLEKKFGEQNVFMTFSFPNSLPAATSAEIIVSYYQALLDSGKENTALIVKYSMTT